MNQEGFSEGNEKGKGRQHEPQTMNDDREKKKKIVAPPDEITFLREAPIGKGLAAALKLLEERGALRTQETDHHDVVGDQETVGSSLERRDEFGRIMTPKEAFRVDCHKFHGKGFGKRKQEKRRKRYLAELRSNRLLS
ncbi:hypothetical protein RHSIM_Rhsim06G0183100 [Rhododendron simsii]|uniref:Uncharacterized protein n=1 Tax=Rhododendron simsii TaxID=118357 RepID=A0A834H4D2_RHOSS|nr:hypothetical protein RHSIM_Rhsim06G0183100 [Rhododendron simsii]